MLDPWRRGGQMTWVPVAEDDRYDWKARPAVLARKLERRHGEAVTLTETGRFLVAGVEYTTQ